MAGGICLFERLELQVESPYQYQATVFFTGRANEAVIIHFMYDERDDLSSHDLEDLKLKICKIYEEKSTSDHVELTWLDSQLRVVGPGQWCFLERLSQSGLLRSDVVQAINDAENDPRSSYPFIGPLPLAHSN